MNNNDINVGHSYDLTNLLSDAFNQYMICAKKKEATGKDYYKSKDFNVFEIVNFMKSNDGFLAKDADGNIYIYDKDRGLVRRNRKESRINLTEDFLLKKFSLIEEEDLLNEKTTPIQVVTQALSGATNSFKGIDRTTKASKLYSIKDIKNLTIKELINNDWYK